MFRHQPLRLGDIGFDLLKGAVWHGQEQVQAQVEAGKAITKATLLHAVFWKPGQRQTTASSGNLPLWAALRDHRSRM
jgi:hypothetical protein